ncbi:hypothetical protein [Acinetobacter towneri]|uniref:Uncharacterized protein n=1 Tax=Acinetobacter towneri TaxID=202956 RepID=A0A1E8E4S7_9GAMM|nr:hypothetical protein BJN41_00105 [Acinetobacter towneri]
MLIFKQKLLPVFFGTLFTVLGCSESSLNNQTEIIIPKLQYSGDGSNASYSEAIITLEGKCLYFSVNQTNFLPIFATQRAYWDSRNDVLVIDNKSYKNGDRVAYGAGEAANIDLDSYIWITKPNPACIENNTIIINKLIPPLPASN